MNVLFYTFSKFLKGSVSKDAQTMDSPEDLNEWKINIHFYFSIIIM